LAGPAAKVTALVDAGRRLFRPAPLATGLAIGVASWGCEAVAFSAIANAVGIALPLPVAASVYGLSTVVGALSMLPGGIGGMEATMLLFLSVLGAERGAAVVAVVLIRVSTLYMVSL